VADYRYAHVRDDRCFLHAVVESGDGRRRRDDILRHSFVSSLHRDVINMGDVSFCRGGTLFTRCTASGVCVIGDKTTVTSLRTCTALALHVTGGNVRINRRRVGGPFHVIVDNREHRYTHHAHASGVIES